MRNDRGDADAVAGSLGDHGRFDGRPCEDVAGVLVRVALAEHPDAALRARLPAIPTGLTIPREDVDLLVAAGEEMARNSPGLRAFIDGIDTPVRPPGRPSPARQ